MSDIKECMIPEPHAGHPWIENDQSRTMQGRFVVLYHRCPGIRKLPEEMDLPERISDHLGKMSGWIDNFNEDRLDGAPDSETITWGRLAKIIEEAGEVVEAYIGATGQNPRKGVTKTMDDVAEELLDVAVTALGAYAHLQRYYRLQSHTGSPVEDLDKKLANIIKRIEDNS
jgi:NTP pyrophosphatase (non-canonical NTP hydrolase)